MQVTKEEVRPRILEMKITAEAEQVDKAYEKAYKRAAQQVQVPGFRKGKAPRALLERYVSEEAIQETAQDILVQTVVHDALTEADIEPFDYPQLDKVEMEGRNQPATITISVPLEPEVKLGDYKGIPAERKLIEVTDEHVNQELQELRERNARLEAVEAAEIKADDLVKIQLEMELEGKPLPGEARETVIEVGKNVPSVDEALIGAKPGDEVSATIEYGEDDPDTNLAGKTAVAKMKIIERMQRILPELSDDFVKEISDIQTLDELKADIKERLIKIAADATEQNLRNSVVDEAIKRSEVAFPDTMTAHDVSHELSDLVKRLEERQLTLDDYLKHENKDMDQLRSEMETTVNERIKGGLVLGQIADVEKITVTDEDLNAELDKMAETYKVPVASIRARFEGEGMRNLANSILQRKIVDFLVNAAQVTEVSEKSA